MSRDFLCCKLLIVGRVGTSEAQHQLSDEAYFLGTPCMEESVILQHMPALTGMLPDYNLQLFKSDHYCLLLSEPNMCYNYHANETQEKG